MMKGADVPPATLPGYDMTAPNAAVRLYSGRVRVTQGAQNIEADGTVRVRWQPTLDVEFVIPSVVRLFSLDQCALELAELGVTCDGTISSTGGGGLKGYVDRRNPPRIESGKVKSLRLHVPNFVDGHGEAIAHAGGWYAGRIRFDVAPWAFTIDKLPGNAHAQLSEAGGYIFTHVLVCERDDGAEFDPASLSALLPLLDRALSFCAGRWTGGMLAVGHDAAGVRVHETWRMPWITSFQRNGAWLDRLDADGALATFVPAYVAACRADATTERALNNCIHWYIEANAGNGGLEGAIVMTLMALELLSWLELVNRRGEDAQRFERRPLHDNLRNYLTGMKVPFAVPVDSNLTALSEFVEREELEDGVEALARLRNRTVHPPKQGEFREYPFELLEQAWRYGLFVLERSLLAQFGYRGRMHERIRAGWPVVEVQ